MNRRLFLASSLSALGLPACGPVKDSLTNGPFRGVLLSTEQLNHAVIGTHGLAREYREADVDRRLPRERLRHAERRDVRALVHDGFRDYRLVVDGLVERPQPLSLARAARRRHANADHAPRLRRRLERDRQVARRAARRRSRDGAAEAGGALLRLPLLRRRPVAASTTTSRSICTKPRTRRRSSRSTSTTSRWTPTTARRCA